MKAVDSKKDISWPSLTIQHPYDSLSKSVIWKYIVSSKPFFLFMKTEGESESTWRLHTGRRSVHVNRWLLRTSHRECGWKPAHAGFQSNK